MKTTLRKPKAHKHATAVSESATSLVTKLVTKVFGPQVIYIDDTSSERFVEETTPTVKELDFSHSEAPLIKNSQNVTHQSNTVIGDPSFILTTMEKNLLDRSDMHHDNTLRYNDDVAVAYEEITDMYQYNSPENN